MVASHAHVFHGTECSPPALPTSPASTTFYGTSTLEDGPHHAQYQSIDLRCRMYSSSVQQREDCACLLAT